MPEYRAYLSSSLNRLFDELDARWPNRNRNMDGWYNPDRQSVGHNRGERGLVHAIDFSPIGINPGEFISDVYKGGGVLRYIIWNEGLYHARNGFAREQYTGDDPHTNHLHVEINQTEQAENYTGQWEIAGQGEAGMSTAEVNDLKAHVDAQILRLGQFLTFSGNRLFTANAEGREWVANAITMPVLSVRMHNYFSALGKLDPVAFAEVLAASPEALAALTAAMREQLSRIPTSYEVAKTFLDIITGNVRPVDPT